MLIYLIFLLILGLPIIVMEFAVGRASRKSCAASFRQLEPAGTKWHLFSYFAMAGNYLLMMFYTTVCGWMFAYFYKMLAGEFTGKNTEQIAAVFDNLNAGTWQLMAWMLLAVVIGFAICWRGLRNGVEKVTKIMMTCLLGIMIILVLRALILPGTAEGIKFYLWPDFNKMSEAGIANVIFDAMGQAFFTLSIGIGSMAIFGSYIGKERSLTGEAVSITLLDTFVAIMAGLIIFPTCFSYGVNPDSGPNLVFVTLPNIFNSMAGGSLWGALFFLFLSFAALSTIIAVFENIVSFGMDLRDWSRKKSILINGILVTVLSIPCVLGFNVLSGIHPLGGTSTIQDLEDFIVSNNLLPLGSMVYLMFCTRRYGWGWDNFISEADMGKGLKFPKKLRFYICYILPLIVLTVFVYGYIDKFILS